MRKRHEKENLTETNLLTLVPPIKFLSVCTSCSGAYLLPVDLVEPISQRTSLSQLVRSLARFPALNSVRLAPKEVTKTTTSATYLKTFDHRLILQMQTEITLIQGVYSMGIHLSCSLAQVRQNAMIQLPRGFVSGCTRTGPSMAQGHPDLSSYVAAEAKE